MLRRLWITGQEVSGAAAATKCRPLVRFILFCALAMGIVELRRPGRAKRAKFARHGCGRTSQGKEWDPQMAMGKVKWFNDQKGFGFITPESGSGDVMVHHSVIEGQGFKTLDDGEPVEYEAEPGPKGMKATRVRRMVVAKI